MRGITTPRSILICHGTGEEKPIFLCFVEKKNPTNEEKSFMLHGEISQKVWVEKNDLVKKEFDFYTKISEDNLPSKLKEKVLKYYEKTIYTRVKKPKAKRKK